MGGRTGAVVSPVSQGADGGALKHADEPPWPSRRVHGGASCISRTWMACGGDDTVASLGADEVRHHVAQGAIAGGMAMKVDTALQAVARGCRR